MYVLLGATAAASKRNLIEWVDNVIMNIASDEVLVYDHRRQGVEGHHSGMQANELRDVLSKLKILLECIIVWHAGIMWTGG